MTTTGAEVLSLLFSLLLSLAIVVQTVMEGRAFRCGSRTQITGKAAVILPVKGLDPGLESTLSSLESQDYDEKEIHVIVDSPEDPAVEVVLKHNVKLVLNEWQCRGCSGKVAAILTALRKVQADYYVFADSDTVYPKGWLSCMLSLVEPKRSVATTFSWPSPVRPTLRNWVRAGFWTLGFESIFSPDHRFLWGGSMAFSREFFDDSTLKALESAWCDDCTLGSIAKSKGYRIEIAGTIPLNVFDERGLLQFLRRQTFTVYLYSRKGLTTFVVVWLSVLVSLTTVVVNPLGPLPLLLWVVKNAIRGMRAGGSVLPALFSPVSSTLVLFLLPWFLRTKEVMWRGARISVRK